MKKRTWLGLLTVAFFPLIAAYSQPPAPEVSNPDQAQSTSATTPANLSPGVAEVMQLAEAGNGEDVILAYIQNSTSAFNLSADQILYLRDNGLSSAVITAILNRDNVIRSQTPNYN